MANSTRRAFLSQAGIVAGLTAVGAPALPVRAAIKTSAVGSKFYPNGKVKSYPGNTIVCHLPQQGGDSAFFNGLLEIYRNAPDFSFFRKATLLPPSSYHMTVFEGVTEASRNKPDQWPWEVQTTASLDDCSKVLSERLSRFRMESDMPLRMQVDMDAPVPKGSAIVIPLKAIDQAEENRLRDLRRRLSAATGIRIREPDTYAFHTSLAYWIKPLTADEEALYEKTHSAWRVALYKVSPVISLGPPEFCLFQDMFAFERQFFLQE